MYNQVIHRDAPNPILSMFPFPANPSPQEGWEILAQAVKGSVDRGWAPTEKDTEDKAKQLTWWSGTNRCPKRDTGPHAMPLPSMCRTSTRHPQLPTHC